MPRTLLQMQLFPQSTTDPSMEKPLLSFIVVCFNQEAYIAEAIQGALAQTYSPLEIIISDDASKDRTFEVARETVSNYRGPHSVRLNRNPVNLGMGRHISSLMSMCHGQLVVGAAGDDVSLPERTELIYQAWESSGRRATSIFSSYDTISSKGDDLGVGGTRGDVSDATLHRPQEGSLLGFLTKNWPVVVGCTHAWSPSLFEYFGPLKSDLEDLVLSFRSLSIGKLLYIHKPLIKYRRHGENSSFFAGWDDTSSFEHRERRLRWVNTSSAAAYENFLLDLEKLYSNGQLIDAERVLLQKEAQRMKHVYTTELRMMNEGFFGKLSAISTSVGCGYFMVALRSLPRILPLSIYRQLYILRAWWRSKISPKPIENRTLV